MKSQIKDHMTEKEIYRGGRGIMPELKTLKDLVDRGSVTINSGKRVRAEAVKHIKENSKPIDKEFSFTCNDWIKHFFNITKEELEGAGE